MINWSIGGVPEHFNLPWQDLIARLGADSAAGPAGTGAGARGSVSVQATWHDFPGGTGAMVEAMGAGELDIAVLLTEGAVAGIARGAAYSIVSNYVVSPLIWGIHVVPAGGVEAVGELAGARFAISRFGSGSHLMALALANEHGWKLREKQFVVVGSLAGAVRAFGAGEADVFLWERFMTQPVVDRGDFRRIGDFVAPWSAFVTCANPGVVAAAAELEWLIDSVGSEAGSFARDPATPARVAAQFGLDPGQAGEWLGKTRWAAGRAAPDADVAAATEMLRQAGVLPA